MYLETIVFILTDVTAAPVYMVNILHTHANNIAVLLVLKKGKGILLLFPSVCHVLYFGETRGVFQITYFCTKYLIF